MEDQSSQTMYASAIGRDTTPEQIVEACLIGAKEIWNGDVRFEVDEGRPVVAFYGAHKSAGEVLIEACTLAVAEIDGCFHLVTIELIDNAKSGAVCCWSTHCSAVRLLGEDTGPPLTGEAAQEFYASAQGNFVGFSKD